MARNERIIDASPEQVFAVLADPSTYAQWVVGAKSLRDADSTWPQKGSQLHHSTGVGPLTLNDSTEVVEVEPPGLLVLDARGRPFGTARIELRMLRHGEAQTRVVIDETIQQPQLLAVLDPLLAPLVRLRNIETLRRLAAVTIERRDVA